MRRNADAAPIADALTARGVPVEVVGLSGLLSIPEVADVVAMLRLAADPTAGSAAVRILTGPRWRLGAADVAALWRRAVELDAAAAPAPTGRRRRTSSPRQGPTPTARAWPTRSATPAPRTGTRPSGSAASSALGRELTSLRAQLHHPLPELVAEIRWMLGVDAEVRAAQSLSAGWGGAEHLDAFADVVAEFAGRPSASVAGLLAFLDAAMDVENGLAPAEITVARDRVQILTVHAAKGLEWQVVAVPHLSGRVFPSTGSARTWLSDAGDLPPLLRGDRASVSEHGVPVLDTSDVYDRKALSDKITAHRKSLDQRRIDEERRLLYVALTRAEDTLVLSGHHWGATESKPRGPSDFLLEIKDVIDRSAAAGDPCGVVERWAPAPADGDVNPLRDNVIERAWPVDAMGADRRWVDRGAELVAKAMAAGPSASAPDVEGWVADVDALLAERAQAQTRPAAVLPPQLSVSALVDIGRDRDGALRDCNAGCPCARTRRRCSARHFTTGCSGSSTPSGCSTSRTCRGPSTANWVAPRRSGWPSCRARSRCRRGRRASPSRSRCRST